MDYITAPRGAIYYPLKAYKERFEPFTPLSTIRYRCQKGLQQGAVKRGRTWLIAVIEEEK